VAKLIARLLAASALWGRIQTSLKNAKWAIYAKEWPTHSSAPKKKRRVGRRKARREELNGKKKESKKNGKKKKHSQDRKEEGKGKNT
jgi:hypothetical protein